jgi:hypothetical protein
MSPAWASLAVASSASGYVGGVKWAVVATVAVPNLVPGEGAVEDSALGMAAVLEANRGAVQREVRMTVEAPDAAEAERMAIEQLTSGVGGELAGVPEIASMRVEPDE